MAYKDFSLETIEKKFGIRNREKRLFTDVKPLELSQRLKDGLAEAEELPLRSEKAKSEGIVFPVLLELRNRNQKFFTIYSGENLDAAQQEGLNGECDFMLALNTGSFSVSYPLFQIVEAKKHDIELGIPQCAAQMIGAKVFNKNKGVELERLYGCVTTGDEWLFMMLENDLYIDIKKYYFDNMGEVLGVFQTIIDYFKLVLKPLHTEELALA